MSGRNFFSRAALAAVSLVCLNSAWAQAVYGVGGTATDCSTAFTNVYTVNPTSGAATAVGTLTAATTASANYSADGRLYYIERVATVNPRLFAWTTPAGPDVIVGTTSLPAAILRMAFSPDGKLYAATNTNQIFEINPASGATIRTITYNIPIGGSGDFAFSENGDLYVVANDSVPGNPYQLWRIPQTDISTLTTITSAAPVGANLGIANTIAPNGMALIPPTGTCGTAPCFAMSTGATNTTYLVNGTTGTATTLGTTGACLVDLGRTYQSNLFIGKTDGVLAVNAGGATTYTITVTNSGPSAIYNTPVVDTAPANVTFGSWTCAVTTAGTASDVTNLCGAASGTGNINTTVNMRSGAVITYTVNATIAGAATGSVSNVATVTPLRGVLNLGTGCATAGGITRTFTTATGACASTDTDTVTPVANLAITKTDGVISVNAGGTSTYTIRVTNNGPSSVTGANLLDPSVANLTMGTPACSATPGQCVTAPTLASLQTGGVTLPALLSGQFYEITVSGTVAGAATGNIINTATATPPAGTTNLGTSCIAPMVYTAATGACSVSDTNAVGQVADLVISKTDGVTSVNAGGSSTYTIRVTNNGPSSVSGAVVRDPAVTNLTLSGAACSATPGQCVTAPTVPALQAAGGVTLPALNSGQFYEFTVVGTVSGAATGGIANAVTVTPPAGITNTGTSCVTGGGVTRSFNVGTGVCTSTDTNTLTPTIAKTLVPASIAPGGVSQLTLSLGNTNTSAATLSAALTDSLPAGVTVASPNGLGGTCTGGVTAVAGSGSVTYNNGGTIPANGSCTILVNVTSSTPGTVTNTIAAGALQTSNGNNTAATSAPLTVNSTVSGTVFNDANGASDSLVNGTGTNTTSASLTAYLVDSAGNVVGSSPVAANGTYSIPNVANGTYAVVLSNTAGIANGSPATPSLPAGWVNTGEGLTPAGELAAQVNGSIASVVVNNANVTGANFGIEQAPTAQNNTNATQPNPGGTASVAVAAGSFTTNATDPAGGTITGYLILSFPTGADSLTIGTTIYTTTGAGGTTLFPATGGVTVPAGNIGTITVDPAGSGTGPATVVITFRPVDNAGVPSMVPYTATVPLAAPVADLAIQKNGPASVNAGGSITYTLTVSNAGTSAVSNVAVTDNVPAQVTGLTVSCGTANGGADCGPATNYFFSGNALSANVASLPSGGSVVLTISGTVAANTTASFTNTAVIVVPPGVTDPNPANNMSSVTSGVGIVFTQADLSITKTGTSTVQVGGAISYIIKVTNAGPANANGAVVADAVPAAITGVTATCVASGGAQCPTSIAAGNSINLVIPALPSASSIELLVKGMAPTTTQSLVNTATVAPPANIADPIPSNNSSTANTTVTLAAPTTADLAVVKTGPSTVASGGTVSYTVTVVNNGPGSANGALFADPLPSVLTNATATCAAINGAACGAVVVSGTNVSSAITILPVGGVVTFNITATAPVSGSFSNTATITPPAGVNDPNTTNNVSGAVITQIQTTGIAGVVWRDANRNSALDAGEQLLSGVTVTVRNSSGVAVGTTQTDAKGAYSIVGLVPGSGYSVNFDFGNLDRGLVIPQNTNASLNGTATNQTTISNVTLTAGVVTLDQNARVVDPGGVVYDSVTRLPIAGAAVTLLGPNGQPVPASQLLATTPNNQVTPATGSYEFLLNGTAPTGTYTLQVTPPAGYGRPNAVNGGVAQPTPRDVPPAPGTLLVQPQTAPPAVGASTVYHFVLNNLGPGSQDVLNNHIPLDSRVAGNLLINKIAATSVAEVGDSVKYAIRINNTNNFILSGAVVRDTASAGFRFIAGTAKAAGVSIADPSGKAPTLSFALPPLAPNSTTELTYFMRLGVGSQQSDGVNRAQLFGSNGQVLSNLAAAKVRVTGGVLGADACIIGKVFVDCIGAVEGGNVLSSSASGDQVQRNVGGSNELGVPGVRVVMETGAYAITDSEGKYSICPVTPSTHVLRVDKRTLPTGSRMLPQSNRNAGDGTSLFADVKNGELFRADFMEGSCSTEVVDQIKARRAQGNVNAPETERPDATQFRNQNSPQPFLPKPQQILPDPRQNDGQPSKTEGK